MMNTEQPLDAEGLRQAAIAACDPDKCIAVNDPDRPPCTEGNCNSLIAAQRIIRAYLAASPATGEVTEEGFTYGHCKYRRQPDGCQFHNLHCGYPDCDRRPALSAPTPAALPEGYELFEGKPMKVVNPDRQGWWRFHEHRDRDGYCDNPARGY